MRKLLLLAAVLAAACDGNGSADGARGRCAAGGQVLGGCDQVATVEEACWKLVDCAVIPVSSDMTRDWGDCVDRIDALDATSQDAVVACVDAASCDELTVNDSPSNPYEWPDCLQYP